MKYYSGLECDDNQCPVFFLCRVHGDDDWLDGVRQQQQQQQQQRPAVRLQQRVSSQSHPRSVLSLCPLCLSPSTPSLSTCIGS